MTTLNLLVTKKNVLVREKQGRAFVYRPSVTREEVSQSILTDLKSVLFGNRLPTLVLSLLADSQSSPRDTAILREAIQKLEEQP